MDARVRKLAHNLIAHSLKLQPGEKVLIETRGLNVSLVQALVQEAYAAGGPLSTSRTRAWTAR